MENPSIEDLILNGIIEVSGIDSESGEFLYNFTKDFREAMPEIYEIHIQYIYNEIMYLWEKGFVHLEDVETDNPIVSLTKKALDEHEISSLPEDKQDALKELKRILKVI